MGFDVCSFGADQVVPPGMGRDGNLGQPRFKDTHTAVFLTREEPVPWAHAAESTAALRARDSLHRRPMEMLRGRPRHQQHLMPGPKVVYPRA